MPRLTPLLVALALSACASHEAPPSTTARPTDKPTEQAKPAAKLDVAVASVTMQQNCPDPPEPVAAAAAPVPAADAVAAAQAPIVHPVPGEAPALGKMSPGAALARQSSDGPGGWQPPCVQSTMQLSVNNTGDAPGTLEIKAVRLLDLASKKPLANLEARRPSLWNDSAGYQKWDQSILPGATLKVSYSLNEPDWMDVQNKLGAAANLYTTPFMLELDITIGDSVLTIRSPEFMRQEIHMIVT